MVVVSPQPFVDSSIQAFEFTAETNGGRYEVRIGLPPSYGPSDRSYPLLVMLDADVAFGTVHETMVLNALWSRAPTDRGIEPVPEYITVGVALPDRAEKPLRRNFEYMPDGDPADCYERPRAYLEQVAKMLGQQPRLGGAAVFQAVLQDEILPIVETLYRVSTDRRMLVGVSAGGSFCCHSLFTRPGLFTDYVIVSPGIVSPKIFDLEAAWAKGHDDLRANVFLSAGQDELGDPLDIVSTTARLAEQLRGRRYPGLNLHAMLFPDASHVDTLAPSLAHAFKRLFGRTDR